MSNRLNSYEAHSFSQVSAENNFGKGPSGVKTFTLKDGLFVCLFVCLFVFLCLSFYLFHD